MSGLGVQIGEHLWNSGGPRIQEGRSDSGSLVFAARRGTFARLALDRRALKLLLPWLCASLVQLGITPLRTWTNVLSSAAPMSFCTPLSLLSSVPIALS